MTIKVNQITEISLKDTKTWGHAIQLGNGLILTLMALCRKGEAQYRINNHRQKVTPGDLFFISQRHIIEDFTASPDFECQCIIVSPNFYHDFVQDVKNVSSLLLFSMNYPVVKLTEREMEVYGPRGKWRSMVITIRLSEGK